MGSYLCHNTVQPVWIYTVDSEIFARVFFFANSIKRHISDVKNSRLRQDLPISINERVILPFREGFIFTKLRTMRSFAKIKSSRKFPNLQYTLKFLESVSYFIHRAGAML